MKPSLLSIQLLVSEVKNDIFSENAVMVTPSAYDTAWLAMIPEQKNGNGGPMFTSCLKWIIENQKEGGFWGENNEKDLPSIDSFPATLACSLALKKWNIAHRQIENGLQFIYSKVEILLKINYQDLPRWFVLVFPAMIEKAEKAGLNIAFPTKVRAVIANIFVKRQQILEMEKLVDELHYFPPLISYMEALPSTYNFDQEETVKQYLSSDGSLFQSPSATAQAFMDTRNVHCLNYLRSLLQKFPNGVPAKYPVDEDLIKLCMVDHIKGLGLAEHFNDDIGQLLAQIYRNVEKEKKSNPTETDIVPTKLFKDALAFRLLRVHGYCVNPEMFCWFLQKPEILSYIKENHEYFISTMYNVYRATNLLFPGETELEEARKFSKNILDNYNARNKDHNILISKGLQNMINYELSVPWTARLDLLYHRKWIEENKISPLWIGKTSFYRLSSLDNKKLLQLAVKNFEFQQSIYMCELEDLKGWSKKYKLSEMGFGREKTMYTYFAVAASCCLPHDSTMRLVIAKIAILITVADDFYDMEGSLSELEILTDAVNKWDGTGLCGHSKTIFDALDDLVYDIAANFEPHETSKIVSKLRDIWQETFIAWMVERRWSLTGYIPSMDEYLETGMRSIAAHTVTLPATTFLTHKETSLPFEYSNITKLLMTITRLVNDTQSYQKELVDGKINFVLLHMKQNPNITIQDSIEHVQQLVETKTKEFLKHVFVDGFDEDMSKSCKQIHLSCMKVFQMFFNSANLFDSETALLDDIKKAIYLPIDHKEKSKPLVKPSHPVPLEKKKKKKKESPKITTLLTQMRLKHSGSTSFIGQRFTVKKLSVAGRGKVSFPLKFNVCLV